MPAEKEINNTIKSSFTFLNKISAEMKGIIILSPCGSFIDDKCQNLFIAT